MAAILALPDVSGSSDLTKFSEAATRLACAPSVHLTRREAPAVLSSSASLYTRLANRTCAEAISLLSRATSRVALGSFLSVFDTNLLIFLLLSLSVFRSDVAEENLGWACLRQALGDGESS